MADAAAPRPFVLSVPADAVDVASDVLWQLGVRGVEERTIADDTVELWTSIGDQPDARDRAVAVIAGRWPHRFAPAVAAADTWRDFARPVSITDDVVVVPAWQELPDGIDPRHALWIEPGSAFGLGDHPTTILSLRALRTAVDAARDGHTDGVSVLDVGCGTGVLSVAAARFGAAKVRAIDVSSAAAEATQDNARRNDVSDVVEVDTRPLAAVEERYDIVVANILAPTLVELADDLVRTAAGALVISGVLDGRHGHVLEALRPLVPVDAIELDGWVAVTLR